MASKLTARQQRFVVEYLVDLNATQAAIRAGYTPSAARGTASRLLDDPRVQSEIQAGQDRRAARVEVKADTVLRELLRLATIDVVKAFGPDGKLLALDQMPEEVRRAIASVEVVELFPNASPQPMLDDGGTAPALKPRLVKLKFWDKPKALELLGKHLGLFVEKLQLSGTVTVVHRQQLLEKISAALAAAQPKPAAPVAQA